MTTKMRQKISTVLAAVAIIVLLTVIIVVWVQVDHGAFKSKEERFNKSFDNSRINKLSSSSLNQTQQKGFQNSHLDALGTQMEFIKPIKIDPPPLHDHDIIFDQLHNNEDHPVLRHHSGHFRHSAAEIWDPHPQYEIRAFGQVLILELTFNYKFVSPKLHLTHVWENYTWRATHDGKTSGCFYTGKVKGEENSDVAVSLCNGMTGYIRTSEGNYYIEPVEKFHNDSITSILHRIKKLAHKSEITDDIEGGAACGVKENSSTEKMLSNDFKHFIKKRDLIFDLETPTVENRRSVRDILYETETVEFVPVAPVPRPGNLDFHIEILVVADQSMAEYHSTDQDLNHYILTLMSHVALLYKHATIGNPISLAVVEIVILKETKFPGANSDEKLKKFCNWQVRYASHYTHQQYDTAILFTRERFCSDESVQCNTLGFAEVGSMCNPNSSCAIVLDQGLSTSYTIAHELGHILSMIHDDDQKCVKHNKGQAANIMGKTPQTDTKPWMWSNCSRHFLNNFLESSKSSCLFDEPNRDIITTNFMERFPGERFKVDKQCELEFGIGYKLCPYSGLPYCGSLWCTSKYSEGCKTKHMPWADGTKCGDYSWCHQGKCVPYNRNLLDRVPGGWGQWMPWGPCSRSCGGGVKMSKRKCDSPPPANGGAYCKGKNVRYTSCNFLPCDSILSDFREMQCADFDGNPIVNGLTNDVKWLPKYGMEDPDDFCKLYCRVKHSSSYYMLKEKVTDGTKCGLNTFDICVNGICRHAGCDNRLDSNTTLDECGVCGGDNSQCEEISGTYNISTYGYSRVIRIPKGSSNVYITQTGYDDTKPDDNFLALVDGETGSYILNGNFVVSQFLKDVIFGGMTITYSGSDKIFEYIKTPPNRKLTKDLVLEILSVGPVLPPNITYRYMIKSDEAPRYAWQVYDNAWTKCNSLCSGKKFLRPVCIDVTTSELVPTTHCSDLDLNNLVQQKDCNTHCQFSWNVISRGECSSQCGDGLRPVFYECVKTDSKKDQRSAPANERLCAILPKPSETEPCRGRCLSNYWKYDDWSECSKTCGGGIQWRNAVCKDHNHKTISNTLCSQQEKVTQQICNAQKCAIWTFDDWSTCSATCGKGTKSRRGFCHVDGHIQNASYCSLDELPLHNVNFIEDHHVALIEEDCNDRPCVFWSADSWSDCSVSCGEGVEKRAVFCRIDSLNTVNDEYCKGLLKPNSTRVCHKSKCQEYAHYNREYNDYENSVLNLTSYTWVTAAWSKCTKSCGNGTKSRMVVCRNKDGVENVLKCDQRKVPINVVSCNTHACPRWNFGAWGSCDSQCFQHRQVKCQNHTGQMVDDSQCDSKMRPHRTTTCNSANCIRAVANDSRNYYTVENQKEGDRYKWKFEKWGRCSKSCGRGVKTRVVRCIDTLNMVTVVDQYCNRLKKPKTSRECEKNNCYYVWMEGLWSQCSQTCGPGLKYRNVTCHKVLKGGLVDPNPLPTFNPHNTSYTDYCELHSKPSTRTKCTENNCNDVNLWSVGPWSECSHPCGKKGRQDRQVYCIRRDGKKMKVRDCRKEFRPKRKRKCNRQMCLYRSCKEIKHYHRTSTNQDYYVLVQNKPVLVYCYKMDTPGPEEFISLKYEQRNFAEMYDKSLKYRDSCPYQGKRKDDCDCMALGDERSGYTMFWKVRLNITSLQIIADDYTFSRQVYGKKIPYGTGGDCYSEQKGCTQGGFSIDLTSTSFRLSNSVRWIDNGHLVSSFIRREDVMASGQCGGYCGSCLPDPYTGLAVEIT